LGKTLDVGCGAGRNLQTLNRESIGIDHNSVMIESCRKRGMNAHTTEAWNQIQTQYLGTFDSILFSHVAEHMTQAQFQELLGSMLPLLKQNGRVLIICPQEKGYSTDSTHVEFMDFAKIDEVFQGVGIKTFRQYSFPFPRLMGSLFPYNEFVSIGVKK
jgi:cyclopropane fatty-acyl-phospholipid synthase-like methyltransferase